MIFIPHQFLDHEGSAFFRSRLAVPTPYPLFGPPLLPDCHHGLPTWVLHSQMDLSLPLHKASSRIPPFRSTPTFLSLAAPWAFFSPALWWDPTTLIWSLQLVLGPVDTCTLRELERRDQLDPVPPGSHPSPLPASHSPLPAPEQPRAWEAGPTRMWTLNNKMPNASLSFLLELTILSYFLGIPS